MSCEVSGCRGRVVGGSDGRLWCGPHTPISALRPSALAAATEALVKAALAWDDETDRLGLPPKVDRTTYPLTVAVAAYRKAKGEDMSEWQGRGWLRESLEDSKRRFEAWPEWKKQLDAAMRRSFGAPERGGGGVDDYTKERVALRPAELACRKALTAATEALVQARPAWSNASLGGPDDLKAIRRLLDAVAAYRKAKGEGA